MNKKKYLKNQKRQAKKGKMKRDRKKKNLYLKHTGQSIKKAKLQEVKNKRKVPFLVRIKFYIYKAIRKLRRLGCFVGIHDWKLCSGREGDPMFTCIKCWKFSKKKWGPGGSAKHYEEKEKNRMEVAKPENWEKKGNEYYFKGRYVKLTKEEVKRLEVILGKNGKNN